MITEFNNSNCHLITIEDLFKENDPNLRSSLDLLYQVNIDHVKFTIEIRILDNVDQLKPIYILNQEPIKYNLVLKIAANISVVVIDHKNQQNNCTEIFCDKSAVLHYYLIQQKDDSTVKINQFENSRSYINFLTDPGSNNVLKILINLLELQAQTTLNILQQAISEINNYIEILIHHQSTDTKS